MCGRRSSTSGWPRVAGEKTLPLPRVSTAIVAKTLPFLAVRRSAEGAPLHTARRFMTSCNAIEGTPEYMAPEQWRGIEAEVTHLADIWLAPDETVILLTPPSTSVGSYMLVAGFIAA